MPLHLMAAVPARVIQVLKDFLPAELDLIDTSMADGVVTPDIPNRDYFEIDKKIVDSFPALTIRTVMSEPVEIRPITFGSRSDARHHIELMVHVTSTQGDALRMQKLLHRYATAIIRVLTIQKCNLETAADPVQYAEIVEWTQPMMYSPLPQQAEGAIVRTVTIPLSVRLREVRS